MSQTDATQTSTTQPEVPKQGSPVRLIVLLLVLAVVLGAFLVDIFYMYDSVKAASERLQSAADTMAERPRENGKAQFLTRDGVAEAIGFSPTTAAVEDGRLVEHYRWWGSVPLQRRFIMVEYDDEGGTRYKGFEISNRDIFGNDEDPDVLSTTPPSTPSPNPDPGTGGPPPGPPAPPIPGSGPPPGTPVPGTGQSPPPREPEEKGANEEESTTEKEGDSQGENAPAETKEPSEAGSEKEPTPERTAPEADKSDESAASGKADSGEKNDPPASADDASKE